MLNRNAARPTAFQFTHPRRVRRKSILHLGSASLLVSIHAPTRGATRTGQLEHLGIGVSIHVPTRGATAKWRRHCGLSRFQFTHPRGVRLRRQSARRARARVSIHAPARGATPFLPFFIATNLFQFTHPRGVRLCPAHLPATKPCFNSRTREGCDYRLAGMMRRLRAFQFTYPRGVRPPVKSHSIEHPKFQFTHPRGVRQISTQNKRKIEMFQFTHPRGVRPA